jgi:phosphoribosylformimino-5-aminoimidazole carboxamide ribotide isomerase
MKGFNAESTRDLARALKTPVFASGGVCSMDDIRKLKELEPDGVVGAVIGRALYEGDLKLGDCLKAVA